MGDFVQVLLGVWLNVAVAVRLGVAVGVEDCVTVGAGVLLGWGRQVPVAPREAAMSWEVV